MPNGRIDLEDFEKNSDIDWKLNVLFKTLIYNIESTEKRFDAGRQRFEKLENRKLIDRVYSGMGGVIGGVLAALGFKWGGN